MRKSTILAGAICTVWAAGTLWMWRELRREQARADSAEFALAQYDVLPGAPAVAPARSEPVTEPVNVAPLPPPSTATPETPQISARTVPRNSYGPRQLVNSPEFRKAYRTQQRAMIEFAFRDLPRALNLSPEKAAQVFDLMADQAVGNISGQSGNAFENEEDANTARRDYEERRRKADADMTELLGPSGMDQLQEFRNSMQSRSEVSELRNELASGPDPLREDQYDPLLAVIYTEQKRLDAELRDFASTASPVSIDTRRTELAIAANARILDSARSVLSSTQLAAATDFYRRQNQQMQAQSELTRLQVEAMIKDAQAGKAK